MSWHGALVLAHVLLLVYWLGTDLGVFYSARYVLRRDLSPDARATAAKILVGLDLVPRICLVLMLPVGLSLASTIGLASLPGAVVAAVWVIALLWLALVVALHRMPGAGGPWRQLDLIVRVVLVVVLLVGAVMSFTGNGPFAPAWLAAKVTAYAVAVASGVAIRFALRPFGPAMAALMTSGSTVEVEESLQRTLRSTYPFVFTIWLMLLTAATLGVVQP